MHIIIYASYNSSSTARHDTILTRLNSELHFVFRRLVCTHAEFVIRSRPNSCCLLYVILGLLFGV